MAPSPANLAMTRAGVEGRRLPPPAEDTPNQRELAQAMKARFALLEAPHLDLFEQGIAPEQRNEGVITERD
jgi:hypothetical protein